MASSDEGTAPERPKDNGLRSVAARGTNHGQLLFSGQEVEAQHMTIEVDRSVQIGDIHHDTVKVHLSSKSRDRARQAYEDRRARDAVSHRAARCSGLCERRSSQHRVGSRSGCKGVAVRLHRSTTAPLPGRRRHHGDRHPPRAESTARFPQFSAARNRPFGSTAPPRRGTIIIGRVEEDGRLWRPIARGLQQIAPTCFRTPWRKGPRPAAIRSPPCLRIAIPAGRAGHFPDSSVRKGLLGTITSLSASEAAISSMTPFSTVNRNARTTASTSCSASRLSAATLAPRPTPRRAFVPNPGRRWRAAVSRRPRRADGRQRIRVPPCR